MEMCRPGQSLWQRKVHKVEVQQLRAGFQVQWPEGVIHVTRVERSCLKTSSVGVLLLFEMAYITKYSI